MVIRGVDDRRRNERNESGVCMCYYEIEGVSVFVCWKMKKRKKNEKSEQ